MKRVIYVSAPWCGPCGAFKPILKEVTTELGIPVEYVDVDTNPNISARFGIRNIPTLLVFKNGQVVDKHVGVAQKSQLAGKIDAQLV